MTSKGLSTVLVLLLLTIPALGPLSMAQEVPSTSPAPNQVLPTIAIAPLEPASQIANVTSEEGTTVVYSSSVTASKPPFVTLTVNLDVSNSAGFPSTVEPDTITFTQSGTVPITITVVVPAKTKAMEAIQVLVNGVATMPGLTIASSAAGVLIIAQYFDVKASTETLTGTGNPQEFQISIQNIGNGNDSFSIDIVDRDQLEGDGFTFTFTRTTLYDLEPEDNATVKLKVGYGVATPSGKKTIKLRVTSLNSTETGGAPVTKEVAIVVDVGVMGGGGSQSYLVGGVIAMVIAIIIILLIFRFRSRSAKAKSSGKPRGPPETKPQKKTMDDEEGEEPEEEPEEGKDGVDD